MIKIVKIFSLIRIRVTFNNLYSTQTTIDDKGKAAYKDVKPRVDTRWKKSEIVAKRTSKESVPAQAVAAKPAGPSKIKISTNIFLIAHVCV
jgi:hypothetical protein